MNETEIGLNTAHNKFGISTEWLLILLLATTKLLAHFFTYSNFELHRDAYLYYAQSEHLAWGYVAVPPFIAVVGKLSTLIFGNTVFGLRFFPALIGAVNVVIIGLAVKELGGKKIAIALACLAYIFSPSFLHVNALFQPVGFNHFFWLLASYLILLMIKRSNPKIWIGLGLVFGLAFLTKYSIVFFAAAFVVSLLISKYRYLFFSKYFLMALVIGLAIIFPNLIWQYQHNWPVLMHMDELRETQLVHVDYSDFLMGQLLMNIQALFIWLGALLVLLFYKKENQYQLFGLIYLVVVGLLLLGSGKAYYTLGIYPILFVFGAFFAEKYIPKKYLGYVFVFMVVSMMVSLYISTRFDGIPITTFEKALNEGAFKWEDGEYHDLPQDMADMTGWKEIGEAVSEIYLGLGEEYKNDCDIYCNHYGQAGAVMFYGKKVGVPQPISYNGSFVFWAPDSLTKNHLIWVQEPLDGDLDPLLFLSLNFDEIELKKSIDNKYFREKGTKIYLCSFPNESFLESYKNRMGELKNRYQRQQ